MYKINVISKCIKKYVCICIYVLYRIRINFYSASLRALQPEALTLREAKRKDSCFERTTRGTCRVHLVVTLQAYVIFSDSTDLGMKCF